MELPSGHTSAPTVSRHEIENPNLPLRLPTPFIHSLTSRLGPSAIAHLVPTFDFPIYHTPHIIASSSNRKEDRHHTTTLLLTTDRNQSINPRSNCSKIPLGSALITSPSSSSAPPPPQPPLTSIQPINGHDNGTGGGGGGEPCNVIALAVAVVFIY